VTLLAHSLGSAIIFDVLSRLSTSHSRNDIAFPVANFIQLGSPVAALTAARRLSPAEVAATVNHIVTPGTRYYNVYHPCDPVAYRVEPLICPELSNNDPVCIDDETLAEPMLRHCSHSPSSPQRNSSSSERRNSTEFPPQKKFEGVPQRRNSRRNSSEGLEEPGLLADDDPMAIDQAPHSAWYNVPLDAGQRRGVPTEVLQMRQAGVENIRDRIDYELRPGALDMSTVSEALSSLTAHRCYWTNVHVFNFLVFVLTAPGIVGSWDGAVAEFEDFDDDDDDYGESDNDAGNAESEVVQVVHEGAKESRLSGLFRWAKNEC